MSRWDNLGKTIEDSLEKVIVEESSLMCNECSEVVSDGIYIPKAKLLMWTCSKGHKSRLENFVI